MDNVKSLLVLLALTSLCTTVVSKESVLLRGMTAPRKGPKEAEVPVNCEDVKCAVRENSFSKKDSIRDILKKCLGKDDCCYMSENAKKCEDFQCDGVLDPRRNKRSNVKNLNKDTIERLNAKCEMTKSATGATAGGDGTGSREGSDSIDGTGSAEGSSSEEGSGSEDGSGSVEGSGSEDGSGPEKGSGSEGGGDVEDGSGPEDVSEKCSNVKCDKRFIKKGSPTSKVLNKCLGDDDCCYASSDVTECEEFSCDSVFDDDRSKKTTVNNLEKSAQTRLKKKCDDGSSDGSGSNAGSGSEGKCDKVNCAAREKKFGKKDSIRNKINVCLGKDDCCYVSENAKKCEEFDCEAVIDENRSKRSNIVILSKAIQKRLKSMCQA